MTRVSTEETPCHNVPSWRPSPPPHPLFSYIGTNITTNNITLKTSQQDQLTRLHTWQVIRNTFNTIRPAVAVAMGTSVWDSMPLIVWVVDFAWMHKRGRVLIWGVFMCVATQQLLPSWLVVVVRFSLWNLGLLLLPLSWAARRQYSLYFLIRGWYCSSGGNVCGQSGRSHEGSNWRRGARHMIPVWSLRSAFTDAEQTQEFKCWCQTWSFSRAFSFFLFSPAE